MTSTVSARGIQFSYIERGPNDGPLALVLHGFPDSPVSFTPLLDALGGSGFHAVAVWTRGYAPTSLAPDGAYHVSSLATDANALHAALGGDGRAVLLGHDWGAAATYLALAAEPDRWHRGVAMSVPPSPLVLGAMSAIDQVQRSWYMWLFNTPLGPLVAGANDLALINHLWAQWSPGLSADDSAPAIAGVKTALADPAHLDAALSYYRALFSMPPEDPEAAATQAAASTMPPMPVLYLHGDEDGCFHLVGDPVAHLAEGSSYVAVHGAGHFLQVEQPDVVNASILEFLQG